MNRLIAELQRLYLPPVLRGQVLAPDTAALAPAAGALTAAELAQGLAGAVTVLLDLAGPDGTTRSLVLSFARRGDWPHVAALYQALQDDLELPAPAIAVAADNGYQIWLSLAEPVALLLARQFLAALVGKYLNDLPANSIAGVPAATAGPVALVPSLNSANGKWSAFIDPSMGSMFAEESGLDMAPNLDRQADMLAGLACMAPGQLQVALDLLLAPPEQPAPISQPPSETTARLSLAGTFSDPQSFLLALMNDPAASPDQRIEAAKALLPYFAKQAPS